jgi:hypothetical protein
MELVNRDGCKIMLEHNKNGDISGEANAQIEQILALLLATDNSTGGVWFGIVDMVGCSGASPF